MGAKQQSVPMETGWIIRLRHRRPELLLSFATLHEKRPGEPEVHHNNMRRPDDWDE